MPPSATSISATGAIHGGHQALILGATASSIGALLVGVGALLLLAQAAGGPVGLTGTTFGGTIALPERRLGSGMEFTGSLLVAVGSAILLFESAHLSVVSVILTVLAAAFLIHIVMAIRLCAHLNVVARERGDDERRSLWWCAAHPWWRP